MVKPTTFALVIVLLGLLATQVAATGDPPSYSCAADEGMPPQPLRDYSALQEDIVQTQELQHVLDSLEVPPVDMMQVDEQSSPKRSCLLICGPLTHDNHLHSCIDFLKKEKSLGNDPYVYSVGGLSGGVNQAGDQFPKLLEFCKKEKIEIKTLERQTEDGGGSWNKAPVHYNDTPECFKPLVLKTWGTFIFSRVHPKAPLKSIIRLTSSNNYMLNILPSQIKENFSKFAPEVQRAIDTDGGDYASRYVDEVKMNNEGLDEDEIKGLCAELDLESQERLQKNSTREELYAILHQKVKELRLYYMSVFYTIYLKDRQDTSYEAFNEWVTPQLRKDCPWGWNPKCGSIADFLKPPLAKQFEAFLKEALTKHNGKTTPVYDLYALKEVLGKGTKRVRVTSDPGPHDWDDFAMLLHKIKQAKLNPEMQFDIILSGEAGHSPITAEERLRQLNEFFEKTGNAALVKGSQPTLPNVTLLWF